MFTIKATYRNETRRFSFPESILFPTYEELHHQLYRIFPISHNYYLSRLIFSPDASKPGRILVGKEVYSAEDYDPRIAPLRRLWPNPLLRLTIFDETPQRLPNRAPQRLSLYSVPSEHTSKSSSPMASCHSYGGTLPLDLPSFMPSPMPPLLPPLLPLPQPPVTCPLPPPPAPLKIPPPTPPPMCFPVSNTSHPLPGWSRAETAPCCSVTKGKADIQVLLSSFKEDLERILYSALGTDYVKEPSDANTEGSYCSVPGVGVILPQTGAPPVNVNSNTSSRWCFVCKTSFVGAWYGCVKCPWHVVCPCCFSKSHSAHTLTFGPSHVVQQRLANHFTQIPAQIVREREACDSISGTSQSSTPVPPSPVSEPRPSVHRGVHCDSCNKTVVGIRHKCLDCPDYDLCNACMESGATERHNPFHEFFDIETPGRVYVHTVFGGNRDRSSGDYQQPPNSNHHSVIRQGLSSTPANSLVRHYATCNLCDSAIVGERYKCVVCPDFDTCPSCFRITTEQHPNHGFVRVNKPEDLMMRDSISLRQVVHLAICDSCRKTVRGARYKCMHPSCPDFDLCSDCEALPIPVHPLNHPMLKLKTPDTVIPTVYKMEQTQTVDEPVNQRSAPVCNEQRPQIPHPSSPLATPTKSPEPAPVVVSGQVIDLIPEDQIPLAEEFLSPLGSPASEVLGVVPTTVVTPSYLVDAADPIGSPRSSHSALDIYHQLWPRVNQEMMHLNTIGAGEAMDPATNPAEDTVSELVDPRPLVAEESLPRSPATISVGERHGTCSVSPVSSTKSIVDGYCTPSFTPSNDQDSRCIAQRHPIADLQEIVTADASQQRRLDSVYVGDTNVPGGQIFPPGAEFVKGWHIINNGGLPWPTTTEVHFVAGEMFAPEYSAALRAKVGAVYPGEELDIWTGDLKAPDVPGRYVGYWRLSDGQGNFFGSSVWIDLTVVDHHSDQASDQSLAASSMVMPTTQPTSSVNTSNEPPDAPQLFVPSTRAVTDEIEDPDSDISSVSLVSVPTSDDEDAEWQDTRTHSEPLEYVVLYDRNSEE